MSFWASKALLSAVELGVFTELSREPLGLEALRERFGLHERSAHDFLDALVALGFLRRVDGKYHNTPETETFLDRQKPSYIGGFLEMANQRLYRFWGSLTEALQTGTPQSELKDGTDFFATIYSDPEILKVFLAGMTGVSHGSNVTVARRFAWKDYKTFADVGTAQGDLAVQIARENPHLTGVGFDLPVVKPVFEEYVALHGLERRLSFAGGDFFKDELPKADVIAMGHILHDWDLPTKKTLIRKAYDALPEGGAFVVYEAIIDDEREKNAFGLLMSLNMLIETPGGFDYTGADCMGWMAEAGFRKQWVEHLIGPDSMVIGIK
jgi:hypothetical protein